MSSRKFWVAVVSIQSVILAGCANTLNVTYQSDPPGAVLYQESRQFGYTPVTLQYPVTDEDKKRGYTILQGTSVRWASGASATISSLRADLSTGLSHQFSFTRPDSYPGREADVMFSLELQKIALMRQQVQAQQDQAVVQLYNSIAQKQRVQVPRTFNCDSRAYGNTVNTTCY